MTYYEYCDNCRETLGHNGYGDWDDYVVYCRSCKNQYCDRCAEYEVFVKNKSKTSGTLGNGNSKISVCKKCVTGKKYIDVDFDQKMKYVLKKCDMTKEDLYNFLLERCDMDDDTVIDKVKTKISNERKGKHK